MKNKINEEFCALRDRIIEAHYKHLDQQQIKAALFGKGNCMVIAGPGSGKTSVLISRIHYLMTFGPIYKSSYVPEGVSKEDLELMKDWLHQHTPDKSVVAISRLAYLIFRKRVSPHCILSLTFNKAARREMEQRFHKVFSSRGEHKIHFATLHSFCNTVVRDYERRQNRRLIRIEGHDKEDNKRNILKNIYYEINNSLISDDELEDLMSEISFVKNKMLQEFDGLNLRTKNFDLIYCAYEKYKKTNFLMDFDDMLTYAYAILLKCPDILNKYKSKYRYVQVDEAQDLSKIQFEIIKLLVHPTNHLFIVADDDQSIYKFRGAEPDGILNIEKEFPNCKRHYLVHNYRSSKNIVEISSAFIKCNSKRYDKKHRTNNRYKYDPVFIQTKDEYEQLDFIAEVIKKISQDQNKSVAVLYRNNLSSLVIIDNLERKGIQFDIKQNKLFFFNHWVVLDILAFLKFALDQNDKNAFERIYYKMNRYLSKRMLEHALLSNNQGSLLDAILTFDELHPYQRIKIAEVKKEFEGMAKLSPARALQYIEDSFCYFKTVQEICENRGFSFEYMYNLFGTLKTIATNCSTIPVFLDRLIEIEEILNEPKWDKCKSNVTLSTIHSAKGLEYDCVIMVDLINEEFPGSRSIEMMTKRNDSEMLEEERRLCYVGMTRAKTYLYLIAPQMKGNKKVTRSIFIDEVKECLNKKALDEIDEGTVVCHKQFGEGTVLSVYENQKKQILRVSFNGIERNLDLETCLDKGMLSFNHY
jgi:DNA helicase-2/ATP-dependent DNA helicase PcrA